MIYRRKIWNGFVFGLWITLGTGLIVLLVAAIRKKEDQLCRGTDISIHGFNNNFFVDKKDILDNIVALTGSIPEGKPIGQFKLRMMESELGKNTWIRTAELFFDNNGILQAKITEREPIARIFTSGGNTFYIDSSLKILSLSEKFSARLPVFTGFPSEERVFSHSDSMLLNDIRILSQAIQEDPFLMAMIDQVDINSKGNFEGIPKMGNQVILFGNALFVHEKMERLKLFYKNIMPLAGWNYYSSINLQFMNQVVAKRRDAEDIAADSIRTLQILDMIAANAAKVSADSLRLFIQDNTSNSTDSTMIQQSIERDEETGSDLKMSPDDKKSVIRPISVKTQKPAKPFPHIKANHLTKPGERNNRPVKNSPKPKVVVKPKTDF